MTASDPRVGEIQARLDAEETYNWDDLPTAIQEQRSDLAYLLAELRKRDDALESIVPIAHGVDYDARFANGYNEALRRLRAAVAAANGGERG